MIVRIATEGQYRVGGAALDKIDALDDKLLASANNNNAAEFARLLEAMVEIVRQEGRPVGADEIVESELILPTPKTSLEDARRLFEIGKEAGA